MGEYCSAVGGFGVRVRTGAGAILYHWLAPTTEHERKKPSNALVLGVWVQEHTGWVDRDHVENHSSRRTGMGWGGRGGHGVWEEIGWSW